MLDLILNLVMLDGWMRYLEVRFEYVPLALGWVGGNIRSVLHTKVHYISTTANISNLSKGLYFIGLLSCTNVGSDK